MTLEAAPCGAEAMCDRPPVNGGARVDSCLLGKGRLIVVANKIPVQLSAENEGTTLTDTGIFPSIREAADAIRRDKIWVGYLGCDKAVDAADTRGVVDGNTTRYVNVPMPAQLHARHYQVMCNSIIWPIFHHKEVGDFPVDAFETYEEVNRRFCDAIESVYEEGDIVWVNDYHLMLLPEMLRARPALRDTRIVFFLHVPFPNAEVYRRIPWNAQLVKGIIYADLLGFHTHDYLQHFLRVLTRVLGIDTSGTHFHANGRRVAVGAYPVGLSLERVQSALRVSEVQEQVLQLRELFAGRRVVIGVDRMDYIKGLPEKLMAFERMLEDHPEMVGKVVLVQIAAPSRTHVEEYQRLRREVEELVGRINARFYSDTNGQASVFYKFNKIDFREVAALHSVSDVCFVTSLRDGMNIVSQEYIVCQKQNTGRGVLVLSEFTGAARCLSDALRINPWNIPETASTLYRALNMSSAERKQRHNSLYKYVMSHTAAQWGRQLIGALASEVEHDRERQRRTGDILAAFGAAKRKLVVAHGGFLSASPSDRPGCEGGSAVEAARRLLAQGDVTLVVFDLRSTEELDRLCCDLDNVYIAAEYGCFLKRPTPPGTASTWEWLVRPAVTEASLNSARKIMQDFAKVAPGSCFDEGRQCTVHWSWAECEHYYGAVQAQECSMQLGGASSSIDGLSVHMSIKDKCIDVYPKSLCCTGISALQRIFKESFDFTLYIDLPIPDALAHKPNVYICEDGAVCIRSLAKAVPPG